MDPDKIKKTADNMAELLANSIKFIFDLIKFSIMIMVIIVWTFVVFITLSSLKLFEKLWKKTKRRAFLLSVKILEIYQKLLTFYNKFTIIKK